jgi:hypothetical protein
MTRIAAHSNLHLEFAPFSPHKLGADVVILAGDTYAKSRRALGQCKTDF